MGHMGLAAPAALGVYKPRRPQASPLFRLVQDQLHRLQTVYDERVAREYGPWRPGVLVGAVRRARRSDLGPASRGDDLPRGRRNDPRRGQTGDRRATDGRTTPPGPHAGWWRGVKRRAILPRPRLKLLSRDFVLRLSSDATARHLILETKGYDPLDEVKEAAAQRWCAAVTADGRYGHWSFAMARKMADIPFLIDAAGDHAGISRA